MEKHRLPEGLIESFIGFNKEEIFDSVQSVYAFQCEYERTLVKFDRNIFIRDFPQVKANMSKKKSKKKSTDIWMCNV
ncbi:unnamed protein product [Phyllotreta striolata]|uniref:Uncharacterized protein n=1 Tax=Phyllotreta striolata TaxID=444603 RepID=A0A9N9TTC8_PHYSR|nr:unnamed protein product [Phyllotreta striolata]